jgi:3-hydroxypropanoate dehydrogenase
MPDTIPAVEFPAAAGLLFLDARTPAEWSDRPVAADTLHRLYELARLAPTAFNSSPARFVFVTTPEAKARLRPALNQNNIAKIDAAPVTVIVGYDRRFFEFLPRLFPARDVSKLFIGNEAFAELTAFRSGTLQGAYLILAARLLGLDAGPMSGFDNAKVDAEFFPDGRVRSNFLCVLGHAAKPPTVPRAPRLEFTEACTVL